MNDRLDHYRERRDLDRSGEPRGPRGSGTDPDGRRYAFQHHVSSTEHYDLRLEHDGVLLSWAVPKGPSTDPRERRLAIRTEDHPVDYVDFEGSIPDGEYGAGAVVVWDAGTWEHTPSDDDPDDVDEALANGHLSFRVDGTKLGGAYTLHRFRDAGDGEDEHWLLVKQRDDAADARRNPTSTRPESVRSGATVDEVLDAEDEQ